MPEKFTTSAPTAPKAPENRNDYESVIQLINSTPINIEYKTTTEGYVPTEKGMSI